MAGVLSILSLLTSDLFIPLCHVAKLTPAHYLYICLEANNYAPWILLFAQA